MSGSDLDGMLLFFVTVAFATFCVLSLGVAPCVFQPIHDFNSIINVINVCPIYFGIIFHALWFGVQCNY